MNYIYNGIYPCPPHALRQTSTDSAAMFVQTAFKQQATFKKE